MSNFNDKLFKELWISIDDCVGKLKRYTPYKCADFTLCDDCLQVVKEYLLNKNKSEQVDWSKVKRGTFVRVASRKNVSFKYKFIFYEDGLCWCAGYRSEGENSMILKGYDPDLCSIIEEGE